MFDVVVFGYGKQGERIVELLLEYGLKNILVFDVNGEKLKKAEEIFNKGIEFKNLNFFTLSKIEKEEILKNSNIVVDTLPSSLSFSLLKEALSLGKKVISVSFIKEDYLELNELSKARGGLLIPDCGAAPGLSHLFSGYSARQISGANSVFMKLGALPINPQPPFYHNITWNIEDLIEEYVRAAKIKEKGKIKEVEPLYETFKEKIFGYEFESFYSDGVRSFINTYPEIKNVYERTLRWKGHLSFIKILKDAGILERGYTFIDGFRIDKLKFLATVFKENFSTLSDEDVFLMEITVKSDKEIHQHTYRIEYDFENHKGALQNAVSLTAFSFILLLLDKKITATGVLPLETLSDSTILSFVVDVHKNFSKAEYSFYRKVL